MDSASPSASTPLTDELVERVRLDGPLRFDAFMEAVLYDPRRGFYATGGRAGARAGDFLTSPEVGPLFGAVVARAIDHWWVEAGSPERFTVVEPGAGPGTLAAAVRLASPVCTDRLQWVLVERTAAQRARHVERLGASSDPDSHRPISGVHLVSVASLPDSFPADVVLANELLDNLPVRVAQRTTTGWSEVWVGVEGSGLVEELQPLPTDDPDSLMLDRLVPDASPGQRVPLQHEARSWLRWALGAVGNRGRVVVLDYADTTASMARRGPEAWMRTYASHGRGAGPLEACGTQDLTCDVAVDQLAEVRPPDAEVTQAEFLGSHGIDELVEQGRQMWVERAHIGDLAAVRARSRVREAEALVDLDGLGAHRVLEWWPTDTADPGSG